LPNSLQEIWRTHGCSLGAMRTEQKTQGTLCFRPTASPTFHVSLLPPVSLNQERQFIMPPNFQQEATTTTETLKPRPLAETWHLKSRRSEGIYMKKLGRILRTKGGGCLLTLETGRRTRDWFRRNRLLIFLTLLYISSLLSTWQASPEERLWRLP